MVRKESNKRFLKEYTERPTTITTTVVSCSGKTAKIKSGAAAAKTAAQKGSMVAKLNRISCWRDKQEL